MPEKKTKETTSATSKSALPNPDMVQDKLAEMGGKQTTKWQRFKRAAGKAWHFVWHDDSLASWLVNVILAFIIIKFIVYPILGWALGTNFPIVAVVSSSMEHPGTFDDWWQSQCKYSNGALGTQESLYQRYGIDKTDFDGYKFTNGFNRGDLMVLMAAKDADVGDTLVYSAPGFSDPIIHRIVGKRMSTNNGLIYETKGDHNCGQGPYEQSITADRVLGKAVLRVPWLGWIKIGFVNIVMYVKCAFTPTAADCAIWKGLS